jgi:hypothetical protein
MRGSKHGLRKGIEEKAQDESAGYVMQSDTESTACPRRHASCSEAAGRQHTDNFLGSDSQQGAASGSPVDGVLE